MSEFLRREDIIRSAYDGLWQQPKNIEDSPDYSRVRLARRIVGYMTQMDGNCVIADIGSGPLSVERYVSQTLTQPTYRNVRGLFNCMGTYLTVDLATIPSVKIQKVARNLPMMHTQANATALPFSNNDIDMAVASHSFDMLGVKTSEFNRSLMEVARVLKPDGLFVANFHHARLAEDITEKIDRGVISSKKYSDLADFYSTERDNPYFSSEIEIQNCFSHTPLQLHSIVLANDGVDQWWNVEASNPEMSR